MHMSEVDLPEPLDRHGGHIAMFRVALTEEQITHEHLPMFQVVEKRKDPRNSWFIRHDGRWCWKLDALSSHLPPWVRPPVRHPTTHLTAR